MITDLEFREAMSRFASGVTVITTRDAAGRPQGLTVSAFCSLSAEPPLVLACINKRTGSHDAFFERRAFVVTVLNEDQQHISHHFAIAADDKFDGIELVETADGMPMIEGGLVTLECTLVDSHDGGDHTIIIGSVNKAGISDGRPLIYFRSDYRQIGIVEGHDERIDQ